MLDQFNEELERGLVWRRYDRVGALDHLVAVENRESGILPRLEADGTLGLENEALALVRKRRALYEPRVDKRFEIEQGTLTRRIGSPIGGLSHHRGDPVKWSVSPAVCCS